MSGSGRGGRHAGDRGSDGSCRGAAGTIYPAEYASGFEGRVKRALTEALGLTQFGVNLTTLEPGAMSSQRHCHAQEDEFIYVLSGEITLVTNDGRAGPETVDGRGVSARRRRTATNSSTRARRRRPTWRSAPAPSEDDVDYPDIDMKGEKRDGRYRFLRQERGALPVTRRCRRAR